MRTGPVQEGRAKVNRWHARRESRSMEECVLLAAARVDAGEPSARFMNTYERHAGDGKRRFFSPTLESFFARFRQGCELEH